MFFFKCVGCTYVWFFDFFFGCKRFEFRFFYFYKKFIYILRYYISLIVSCLNLDNFIKYLYLCLCRYMIELLIEFFIKCFLLIEIKGFGVMILVD